MNSLFTFSNLNFSKDGSPKIEPPGSQSVNTQSPNELRKNSTGLHSIDVVNKFYWTTTPPNQLQTGTTERLEVPTIQLKELRLTTNSLIAQAAYNLMSVKTQTAKAAANLQASNIPSSAKTAIAGVIGAGVGGKITQTLLSLGNIQSSILNTVGALAGAVLGGTAGPGGVASTAGTAIDKARGAINAVGRAQGGNFDVNSSSLGGVMEPYEGLYLTEPTKFVYTFPYFSDLQNVVTNSFQDNDAVFEGSGEGGVAAANILEDYAKALAETRTFALGISKTLFMGAPGIYIEKPKYYNFNNKGEQIVFKFPLINTGWATYEDVQRNWQLLFMLTYQNRPNRKSRDLIDPSVLYEVLIPGVKYHPYAYIDNLTIKFVGARRRMELEVPGPNGRSVTIPTIVPDAYDVSITLQTLINESQNTLYSMLFEKSNLISVNGGFFGTGGTNFAFSPNDIKLRGAGAAGTMQGSPGPNVPGSGPSLTFNRATGEFGGNVPR